MYIVSDVSVFNRGLSELGLKETIQDKSSIGLIKARNRINRGQVKQRGQFESIFYALHYMVSRSLSQKRSFVLVHLVFTRFSPRSWLMNINSKKTGCTPMELLQQRSWLALCDTNTGVVGSNPTEGISAKDNRIISDTG